MSQPDLSRLSARERASIEEGTRIIEAKRTAARKDEAIRQTELAANRSNALVTRMGASQAARVFGVSVTTTALDRRIEAVAELAVQKMLKKLSAPSKSAPIPSKRSTPTALSKPAPKAAPSTPPAKMPASRSTMHFMVAKRPTHFHRIYAGSFAGR